MAKKQGEYNQKSHARPGVTMQKLDELKEAFDLFDTDGSGSIAPNELTAAMNSLGFEAKKATVYQMISDLDRSGSGAIDFDEFLDMMTSTGEDRDNRADIDKVFRLFDDDKCGFLTIKNLRRVSRDSGENISDEELMEMISRADADGDGKVTIADFYNIMTKKKFP